MIYVCKTLAGVPVLCNILFNDIFVSYCVNSV